MKVKHVFYNLIIDKFRCDCNIFIEWSIFRNMTMCLHIYINLNMNVVYSGKGTFKDNSYAKCGNNDMKN